MERREQLLNGLNYVKEMVCHMVNLSNQEVEIEERFLAERKVTNLKSFGVWAKILKATVILAVIGLFVFGSILQKNFFSLGLVAVGGLVFYIKKEEPGKIRVISALCVLGGIAVYLKELAADDNGGWGEVFRLVAIFSVPVIFVLIIAIIQRNRSAIRANYRIARQNQELYDEFDRVDAELNLYRQELYKNTKDWYPVDYYTESAVDWFIWAVQNHFGEDMGTLVRQFEVSEYHRKMLNAQQQLIDDVNRGFAELEQNQQDIIDNLQNVKKQMKVANVLSTMNFCVNLGTQRKLDQQNRLLDAQNRAIGEHTSVVHSVRSAVQENTNAINAYRTQF